MKPSTVLKKARKLIERGWCKHAWAKTADGKFISGFDGFDFNSPKAAKFCALGAIYRVASIKEMPVWADPHAGKDAQRFVERTIGGRLAEWNNAQKNKRPILAGFDRAIALAVKEGR